LIGLLQAVPLLCGQCSFRFGLKGFQFGLELGLLFSGHPVDEKDALKMIVFVLDRPRE